jgi:hypothetical protein
VSLIPGEAPLARAPSIERRQLVPWLALNDPDLLADVEFGLDVMMAASSLHDAHVSRVLRNWVRDALGLGWALLPQLELLQLDSDFIKSREEKHHVKLVRNRELLTEAIGDFDPRTHSLERREAREASAALLELERAAWATCLITGSFVLDELSPRLLNNNLALLDGAIAEFDEEDLAHPAMDGTWFSMPHQLFAGVTIHARTLREGRFVQRLLDELVDRAKDLDGFWVQIPGVTGTTAAATVTHVREFVYPLQERSARPVVADRLGGFGLGFLAGGLAGACMGTAAPEYVSFPPSAYWPARRPGDRANGYGFVYYNQVLMRNFQLHGKRARKGQLAAHRFPCAGCGYHDPARPPKNNREKKLHGFTWHREQAARLAAGAPADTSLEFLRMVRVAEEASREIGDQTSFYAAMRETLPSELVAETGTD